MFESSETNAIISFSVKPVFCNDQLVPLLMEENTPPKVPAKTRSPLKVSAFILLFVSPLFSADQLVPLLLE